MVKLLLSCSGICYEQQTYTSYFILMFYKFNFPCDVPQLSWWSSFQFPKFNSVDVIGIELRAVDSIITKNARGQTVNTARSVGTDKENAANLRNSFLVQGINPAYLPPVILDTGELIDGYTRQSVLCELKQEEYAYLVVRLKEGKGIEDAKDELGLGLNLHDSSKSATSNDYKKRLMLYIRRERDAGNTVGKEECMQWFYSIPHTFLPHQVESIVDKALTEINCMGTMEAFDKKSAVVKGADLLDVGVSDVVALNVHRQSQRKTYMQRTIFEILDEFERTGTIPHVVGFLDKVESEDATHVRQQGVKQARRINKIFNSLMVLYKQAEKNGEEFELVKLEGYLPQIINAEEGLIQV